MKTAQAAANSLLPFELTGNKSAKTLLVFLHGWPDTLALWKNLISRVEGDYQCLNLSYPNYHPSQKLKWGLDFPELTERIKVTVDHVDSGRNMKKLFVCHDWGAIFTYLFDKTYPGYISDIVAMDVSYTKGSSFKGTVMSLFYQLTMVWAFLLGPFLGGFLMRPLINWMIIKKSKHNPPELHTLTSGCGFPYYYLYKRLFLAVFCRRKDAIPFVGYKRSCGMVYIFGLNKPFMFHSDKFLQNLQDDPKCEVHAVKGGHWITENHPDFVFDIVSRRAKAL